jgi:D-3-phosphoglycerate dehydrogenase / 2-oxoglutarate reductase
MNILIAETKDFSPLVIQKLHTIGTTTLNDITLEELPNAFRTYDIFWFRLGFKITEHLLADSNRKVKIIICAVTGLNHIDMEACEAHGVTVLSLKDRSIFLKSVRATAEHTLAITLALMRKLPQAVNATQNGIWDREPYKGTEILGKTVGIIGAGRLGTIVANYFRCLGANVLLNDVKEPESEIGLNHLLEQSDIVSLHINYTEANVNFMGESHFKLMKNTAIFINTSRGSMVDEHALVQALQNNEIAGCASDVIYDEFDLQNSPLLEMAEVIPDKVLLTPHIGGNTYESFEKTEIYMLNMLIEELNKKIENV